ncbi:MAG: nitroreductase family protein [Peptococcales bacterium]|jgi:nitroreductase
MDLLQAIMERRSVRQFLDEEISNQDLVEIIDAARWAPSASNQQMWNFVIVKNREILNKMSQIVADKLDQIAEETGRNEVRNVKVYSTFFNKAPVTIAVFMQPYQSKNVTEEALWSAGYLESQVQRLRGNVDIQSIGAAIQNILLAAHAKGYGTCWMCAPNIAAPEIEKLLGVDETWQLKALIPLGKPARIPKATPRKSIDEILTIID